MTVHEVWTVQRLLTWTVDFFRQHDIEQPRLDAEVLLASALNKDRIYLYVHFDQPLESDELTRFRSYVRARAAHVPLAYVLGRREFMGLDFCVTRDTLIPRPDTELLVQCAIDFLHARARTCAELYIADLGTGTGAIALSLLHHINGTKADAVDLSPSAANVAHENAVHLGLADRISVYTGDLTAPLVGKRYDMIVSNPPYIPSADIESLMPEVRLYEPRLALDGGADGLSFYRRIMAEAPAFLKEGGALAVEVGAGEAAAVAALARTHPRIVQTEIHKDLAGIERVVMGFTA